MQTRLIAVVIRTLQTGESIYDFTPAKNSLTGNSKYGIQPIVEFIFSYFPDQALGVLRNKKGILHRIPFLKTPPGFQRIEFIDKGTADYPRPNHFTFRIEQFLPAFRQFFQTQVIFLFSQRFCPLGHRISTKTVFQGMRSRKSRASRVRTEMIAVFIRNVPEFHKLIHIHFTRSLDTSFRTQLIF